jgi:hypothetical protein
MSKSKYCEACGEKHQSEKWYQCTLCDCFVCEEETWDCDFVCLDCAPPTLEEVE